MKKINSIIVVVLGSMLIACTPKVTEVYKLANTNATDEAKALYSRMVLLVDQGVMIGHQDDILYGHAWKSDGVSDVKQVVGDFPAVFGWELGDLELGHSASLDSVSFDEIREGIKWVNAQGGINTISWHCNNPLTGGNAWDVSSKEVVKSVLMGGEKHEVYVEMLSRVAQFLLSLTDENGKLIPVIFRPYHEHTGSWFWWGQNLCTAEEYLALYHFTVDYFKTKGLNQLIYAYSTTSGFKNASEYLERYPGDDIVDFLGFDDYQGSVEGKDQYIKSIRNGMDILLPLAKERHKIMILAETGAESIPDSTWFTQTLWPAVKDYPISYVLFWRNAHDKPNHYYAPYLGHSSCDDFVTFEKMENTLFLKDIQSK